MRFCFSLALAAMFAASFCVSAQTTPKIQVSADLIIPQPPPTAPISAWRDEPGRKAISLSVAGAELHGFRFTGTDPKAPEILFFNGNGMTVFHTERFYRALAALGPSVTVYDYRGYGFSSGDASLHNFREDALHAYDDLAKSAPNGIVVYGASMGTASAAYIASLRPVTALVLGMPIASAQEEFPVYGRLIGFTQEQIAQSMPSTEATAIFGETALVRQSKAPLLVLGGSADSVVPVQQAREVFTASPSAKKRFVEVQGAEHNQVITSPQAMSAVSEFIKQH